MADPLLLVADLLAPAFAQVAGSPTDPVVRPSDRADAQVNGALGLAKSLGRSPRDVAADVVAVANLDNIAVLDIAGPGFINLTFTSSFLANQLALAAGADRLGVRAAVIRETAVVDYSAPNVAKEMHVGHLRTTVIGDALVRMLQFVGHTVIKENHIGDWGTPFGMLIEHLVDLAGGDGVGVEKAASLDVGDLDGFYKQARVKFDSDEAFKERARHRVVLLQSRDHQETTQLWQVLVEIGRAHV